MIIEKVKQLITIYSDAYEACADSDAIVVCTEWDEFRALDYEMIYESMRKPSFIFDGRLILPHERLEKIGFTVRCIGKGTY